MSYVEFDGELDSPASAGGFVPFSGKLDEPASARPAQPKAAEPVSASGSPEEMGYDALGNPTGSPAPKTEDSGGKVIKELGALRDELFTGVEQGRAGAKMANVGFQANRLQNTRDRLAQLESSGKGDSNSARLLRGEIESLEGRLPRTIGAATEAQGDFQRGSKMTTRPAVAEVGKAKTFDEAWDAFTKNPYDVIAGVTATSLATTLPALIVGAVMGPGAGALAMGGSSAVTEAGSSLSEFAQERGVDTTNAKAVEQFFTNPKNLSEALSFAGKRAGIIGTMDAASGGLASKTLAPKAITSIAGRQAVNVPTQMAAQAATGAGGEAGAQLATKGKIDSPGQVLMEAVGELGGAPLEVAAFGRDVARARAETPIVETQFGPAPAESPLAKIAEAPTVDAAIAAAQQSLDTAISETPNASQPTAVPGLAATSGERGSAVAASGVEAVLGDGGVAGPALDAGSAGNQPAAVASELGAVGTGAAAVDPQIAAMTQGIAALESQRSAPAPSAVPVATMTPGGMLLVQGEPKPLAKFLKDNGITSAIQSATGVTVGRSQAAQAQALLRDFAAAPTIEASQGATNAQRIDANPSAITGASEAGVAPGAVRPDASGSIADERGGSGGVESGSSGQVRLRTADSATAEQVNAAQPTQPGGAQPVRERKLEADTVRPDVQPQDVAAARSGTGSLEGAAPDVARAAAPVAATASADVAGRAQDGARAVSERDQVGGRAPVRAGVPGRDDQARGDGRDALRPEGRNNDDQPAAPVADRAARIADERARMEAQRPKNQKEVSRYNGKFGKGMGHDAAKIEAGRLNRKNDDPSITYRAEEHGDASLENPWAVVGRKVPQAPAKLTERERAAQDRANSPAARREAEAAKPKYAFIEGGLSPRSTAQVVSEFKAAGMDLNVADTVDDLPAKGRARVKSEGLEGVVRGIYDRETDKAWIVRENIGELEEAFFVGMHEAFHRGIARTFPDAKPILNYLELNNKGLRDKARAYAQEHNIGRLEAIEEVLADMAGEGKAADLKGWDKFIAFLKDILQKVADGMNINIPITDAMVEQFVAGIRRAGMPEAIHVETRTEAAPMMSRGPKTALEALSEADELFAIPKSKADTVEGIVADIAPEFTVRRVKGPGRETYKLVNKDGGEASLTIRKPMRGVVQDYGSTMQDGTIDVIVERPGVNPEDVDPDAVDVYLDVSDFKPGQGGDKAYAVAANFAHNTGAIFIGDPNGLSDVAMRRRLEQMISSAMKFGTTDHLAPHPDQVAGSRRLGVPALRWVYGDSEGNIERMIDVSRKAMENAFPGSKLVSYNPADGSFFRTDTGQRFRDRSQLAELVGRSVGKRREVDGGARSTGQAGWRTVARNALFGALGSPDGVQSDSADGKRLLDRVRENLSRLERDPDTGRAYPPEKRILYSRKGVDSEQRASGIPASDMSAETDDATGLPLNADGTVTVYHHTSAAKAAEIRRTGILRSSAEPDVYVTTRKETDTGYGDAAVPIRVNPELLQLDDEFPDGRADYRLSVGKPGGSIKVTVPEQGIPASDKTATPEFKRWFGDSVVTDTGKAGGKPLVVYHSTAADVSEFQRQRGRSAGFFFSPSRNVNMTGQQDVRQPHVDGANVMPVYLALQNPKLIESLSADRQVENEAIKQAKKEGHDGIVITLDGEPLSYIAFNPEQIKSATGNRGTFDPENPDIRFSTSTEGRAPGIPESDKPNVWNVPEPTKADRFIFEAQDGRIDLKRAQEAIKESGREIDEKWDARLAETLFPGRVAHRSQQFLDTEVRPLLENMAVNKVTMDDLSDYLLARHAPERNAQVAKVNPDLKDGGAGKNSKGELMTTAAAKKYIADLEPGQRAKLEAVARKVDAITAGTRQILVSEGLEKPDTVKAWEGAYKFYAPLFKDEGESGTPHPQGSGFSVKGSSSKRATGSTKQVKDVLAHVLMQREAATTRAEKNRVAMSLYGLALSNPNPDFWTTIRPDMAAAQIARELDAMGIDKTVAEAGMQGVPTIRTVDEAAGLVVDRANPMYKSMPGAITLKVGGEDRVILLNANNERAVRMAESLKNLDGLTKLDLAGSIVGKATRWIASVNTQYNPVFGIVNVIRDTQGGIVNLSSTALKDRKAKVLGNVPAALIGIARDLRGDTARTEWSDLFNQFQEAGGQTGYRELFRDAGDRTKAIEKELKSLQSAGKLTPGKASHAVLDLLDDFNTALENAVRLSAFKAALDMGQSKAEAARTARELTVDFNRKGRATREVGPLYAFFNASVQGTARTIATLKSPAGKKIIAGGFALGALQALMLAAAGFDDDEIPEFIKTRNLIIPTGWRSKEKRWIAIPYPLGLHVIPNTGRVVTELSLNGGKNIGKRSIEALGELAGAFNPLGGGNVLTTDGFLKTLLPTVLDPFVELGYNLNFARRPIENRPFNEEGDNRPGYSRARESTLRSATGQVYVGFSKVINEMTGGTPYEAGAASPTPERVRYLAQVVGGGVLREFEKAVNAAVDTASGAPVKAFAIPLSGRFVGEVDADQVEMTRYYEASTRLKKLQSSLKAAEKAGDMKAYARIMKEHPELAAMDDLKAVQKNISGLNKMAVETVENREQMRKIDTMRAAEMKTLNENLRRMEKREPTLAEKLRGEATASR
jgi:hypothetical protein